jgi:hypothetical protein
MSAAEAVEGDRGVVMRKGRQYYFYYTAEKAWFPVWLRRIRPGRLGVGPKGA